MTHDEIESLLDGSDDDKDNTKILSDESDIDMDVET